MRIADLAKELNITELQILAKLKKLKLRAKDGSQELNKVVEIVLRDEFAKEGIGKPVEDEKPKKVAKPKVARKPKVVKAPAASASAPEQEEKPKKPVKAAAKTTVKKKKAVTKVVKTSVEAKPEPAEPKIEPQVEPKKVEAPAVVDIKEPPQTPEPIKAAVVPQQEPVKPIVEIAKKPAPALKSAPKKMFDEPFVTVKPLLKKRRRPEVGGSSSVDGRNRFGATATPVVSAETPLVPEQFQDKEIPAPITVKDFSVAIGHKINIVLKKLLDIGVFANINQALSEEIVIKLAASFGINVIKPKSQEEELFEVHKKEEEHPELLKQRAPVVTFMGHVDHGKTSLLDRIRAAKVADQEHGGITQHIGAYSVTFDKGKITFLDTPGHEAFTAMRARGAHITDLVVLVVAANEGIMPQTLEAINHARAAKVPIIVALNKIDRKDADLDRVKKQLMEHDLAPEDWGGKTVVVGVSAATGEGVDQLLEMIILEAELLDLKANYTKMASGIVVEAHLSKGRGAMATLIVQSGTLNEGDMMVVGPYYGKVKAIFDDHKRLIKEAGPSTAVEVLGLPDVPSAGEKFYIVEDEFKAREITAVRAEKLKNERMLATAKISLEDLYNQIKDGHIRELSVIIKADVQGSLEALREALSKVPNSEVKLKFIHMAVGDVNASDILLAVASSAIVIAFQVGVDAKARQEMEKTPVDVRQYKIIYNAVDDVRNALEGLLAPKIKRHFLGRAEIRNVFKLSRNGIVAGCFVQKGKIRSKTQAEVVRNGEIVFTGSISSLKRFKDDVREVAENYECGITIANFSAIEVGDIIETFEVEQIARKL